MQCKLENANWECANIRWDWPPGQERSMTRSQLDQNIKAQGLIYPATIIVGPGVHLGSKKGGQKSISRAHCVGPTIRVGNDASCEAQLNQNIAARGLIYPAPITVGPSPVLSRSRRLRSSAAENGYTAIFSPHRKETRERSQHHSLKRSCRVQDESKIFCMLRGL